MCKLFYFKIFKTVFVMLVIVLSSACAPAKPESGCFRFAFAGIDEKANVTPLEKNEITWDMENLQLKIFFQPVKNSFLYILLFDNTHNLKQIFPDRPFEQFYEFYNNYKEFYIPCEKNLWELIGDEHKFTLHVIFSVKRLTQLEAELSHYISFDKQPEERVTKIARQKSFLKIMRILQQILTAADINPEKSIPMMGTERAEGYKMIKNYCEEFSFRDTIYEIYSLKK